MTWLTFNAILFMLSLLLLAYALFIGVSESTKDSKALAYGDFGLAIFVIMALSELIRTILR